MAILVVGKVVHDVIVDPTKGHQSSRTVQDGGRDQGRVRVRWSFVLGAVDSGRLFVTVGMILPRFHLLLYCFRILIGGLAQKMSSVQGHLVAVGQVGSDGESPVGDHGGQTDHGSKIGFPNE